MKKVFVFVPVFLAFVLIFTSVAPVIAMSEDISNKVFRLHILANSDERYDQELKLKVRDKILQVTENLYSNCESVEQAIKVSKENEKYIETVAQSVVAFYGYDYDVDVVVTKEYFNTRVYDNFTLPAGVYNSLKINIGNAKGHNWWCVMYPSVCISGSVDDLGDTLADGEMNFVKSNKYMFKFKVVEIYENIKNEIIL